jgi:diacylglycerol kinase family enzyme
VAAVNGRVFINNSSIGLYPSSLRERDKIEATFGKWPAAIVASVRTLVRLRAFTVTIGKETFRTPFVFVGNNEYKLDGIGAPVRTRLDGGILSIFVAKTVSRWSLLKICLFALVGRARMLNDFEVRKVTSMTIKTKKPHLHVSYDGEVRTFSSPLTYEIRKKALHVRY